MVAGSVSVRAGEPLSLAGFVFAFTNGVSTAPYGICTARSQETVAALADPGLRLRVDAWVLLRVESTDTFANGLPVFEVVDCLPEHCFQPSLWNQQHQGFGAWSGFGSGSRWENYAGTPFEERRAYWSDNGLPNTKFSTTGTGVPAHPPTRLEPAALVSGGLQLRWEGVAGFRYDILGSSSVDTNFTLLGNVQATTSGPMAWTAPTNGAPARFLKLRY